MRLYRGDSLPPQVLSVDRKVRGRTFAEYFCGNGLMAKFADGGFSGLVRGKGTRQIAEEHIGYVASEISERVALHSPMLSFSASRDRAFAYLERNKKRQLRLVECQFEDATHFLWELDIDLPEPSEAGLFHLEYTANPVHCVEIVERQLRHGIEAQAREGNLQPLLFAMGSAIAVGHAAADASLHHADLIDAVEFLRDDRPGSDARVLGNARARAERDFEWLLYPADPMPDGAGLPDARFMMNQHLMVSACFCLPPAKEKRR